MTCNCCLGMKLVNHKCLEKSLETNCPICCDFLFTSSATVRALPCGHYMHSACFQVSMSFLFFPFFFFGYSIPLILYVLIIECYFSFFIVFLKKEKHKLKIKWLKFDILPCQCMLGIHLQPLHLSNLQQIFRRYGGKGGFSFAIYCRFVFDV